MALSAVLSLVTIISIYREGGILKRLRATPLRPYTILTAHVIVKLLFTAVTLVAMMRRGPALLPAGAGGPGCQLRRRAALQHPEHRLDRLPHREHRADRAFRAADRRADHVSDARALRAVRPGGVAAASDCGIARFLPLTYAVSLLRGIWRGDGWIHHAGDVAALAIVLLVCTAALVEGLPLGIVES